MKVYYLYDGKQQHGPYSVEELKEKNLSASSLVWTNELNEWTKAGDIDALKPLFMQSTDTGKTTPPPPPAPHLTKPNRSNTGRYAIIGVLIACIAAMGYFMLKPKTSSVTAENQPTPIPMVAKTDTVLAPETKEIVHQAAVKEQPVTKKERFNPAKYLQKTIKVRKNVLRQTVIEGSIKNVSSKDVYKDIVLNVEYRSKTGSTISAQKLTVYEIAKPNKRINFKFKLRSPNGTTNFSTEIVDAILIN